MITIPIIKPVIDSYAPNGDKNNCTVIALSAVTGFKYPKAERICESAGRKRKHGMDSYALIKHFNNNWSTDGAFEEVNLGIKNRVSLNQFLKKFPKGHFYVRKRGHAFVISNGVVLDASIEKLGPKTQIQTAWKYKSQNRLNKIKKACRASIMDIK
jgi:hypothetical protein